MTSYEYDNNLRTQYGPLVCGTDECGRGSWVYSIVAASVVMKPDYYNPKIKDSKLLSEKLRAELYQEIIDNSLYYKIVEADNQYIDKWGINKANIYVMEESAKESKANIYVVYQSPAFSLNPYLMMPKADSISFTVSCASILAKHYHDSNLIEIAKLYPEYNWHKNKGYITKDHKEAVIKYGLSDLHRKSYKLKS
jgi:ribonuclease HII